jgi:glycine reductase
MDVMKDAVAEGVVGELFPLFGSTCGVGTNVASGQKMGADWAKRLKDSGVTAAILTST